MNQPDPTNLDVILKQIRICANEENIRFTVHAQQEMVEEAITLDEVLEAIKVGHILENYPEHRRGACCLLNGFTSNRRPLHIVCTTVRPTLILITVYEPKPPKWITPIQRRSNA